MKKVNFNKTYRSKLERSLDEVIHTNEKNHREVEVKKLPQLINKKSNNLNNE